MTGYREYRHRPTHEPEPKTGWWDLGVCKWSNDPDAFYPDASDTEAHAEVINNYCDVCPVAAKAACLEEALAEGIQHGIRGGLSATARTLLLQRQSTGNGKTHCINGHRYTDDTTITDSRGHRRCTSCLRRPRFNPKRAAA